MLKSYKYRILRNTEQKNLMAQYFGSARFVYNNTLSLKKDTYEQTSESLSHFDLTGRLTALKSEHQKIHDGRILSKFSEKYWRCILGRIYEYVEI